jgi:hypothetical protein
MGLTDCFRTATTNFAASINMSLILCSGPHWYTAMFLVNHIQIFQNAVSMSESSPQSVDATIEAAAKGPRGREDRRYRTLLYTSHMYRIYDDLF